MPSLYQRLIDTGQVNEKVQTTLVDARVAVNTLLAPLPHQHYLSDNLSHLVIDAGRNPPVNTTEIQRALFYSSDYEDNQTLQQAVEEAQGIQGEHSLTATLDKAMKINRGWKTLLPRRKNPGHNRVIEDLTVIVDDSENKNKLGSFRTRGYLIPDNLVMGFAYGFCGFTAAALGIEKFFNVPITYTPEITLGIISGLLWGALAQGSRLLYDRGFLMERAEFIDEKIRQLSEVSSATA